VRLALLANCDLEVGRDVPGLDKLGGVAGLLRYA
jgi:hypothetical protein